MKLDNRKFQLITELELVNNYESMIELLIGAKRQETLFENSKA